MICKHGSLARSCDICQLEIERDELVAKLAIAIKALRYYAGEAAWMDQRLDRSETAENALKEVGE